MKVLQMRARPASSLTLFTVSLRVFRPVGEQEIRLLWSKWTREIPGKKFPVPSTKLLLNPLKKGVVEVIFSGVSKMHPEEAKIAGESLAEFLQYHLFNYSLWKQGK